MAIYIDTLVDPPYMIADSDAELHDLAGQLGLPANRHRMSSDRSINYYLLTQREVKAAVAAGASTDDQEVWACLHRIGAA